MRKRFVIEVEEGDSMCAECPLVNIYKAAPNHELPCSRRLVDFCVKHDLSTMTVTEAEED